MEDVGACESVCVRVDGVQADGTEEGLVLLGDGLGLLWNGFYFCVRSFCGWRWDELSDFEDTKLFPVGFVFFDGKHFHFASGRARHLL